jgi:4-amino-4-deoxychorismate lyase
MSSQALKVLVNGRATDCVPGMDRGLLFGDGVFETIALADGKPRYWGRHMARLQTGCHRLGIAQADEQQLLQDVHSLVRDVEQSARHVVKIIITRGPGSRGYRPDTAAKPTRIVQLHPWPGLPAGEEGVRATLCSLRLGHNPLLAGIKHLNRLEQVMARSEWDNADIREGLLLDQAGHIIEGTMSNLFLVFKGDLVTPDLSRCGVAGIVRDIVLHVAEQQGLSVSVRDVSKAELFQADELFVCNSLIGIWPVVSLDSNRYPRGPVTTGLQSLLVDHDDNSHSWRS